MLAKQKNALPENIINKDKSELVDILDEIETIKNLSKNQLIDVIASNQIALKRLAEEERRRTVCARDLQPRRNVIHIITSLTHNGRGRERHLTYFVKTPSSQRR